MLTADWTASLGDWQMRRGTAKDGGGEASVWENGRGRKWRGKSCWDSIFLEMASRVYDAFKWLRPHRIQCKGDKRMKNWKGFGRKRSWPNFKALYRNSLGVTEKNHETPSVRIAGLRTEIWTGSSRIRIESVTIRSRHSEQWVLTVNCSWWRVDMSLKTWLSCFVLTMKKKTSAAQHI
jgi:hypothetical protein